MLYLLAKNCKAKTVMKIEDSLEENPWKNDILLKN